MAFEELYERLHPFCIKDKKPLLIERSAAKGVAYLWSETPRELQGQEDLDFISQYESGDGPYGFALLRGNHTYGGYYGFFRPDLTEVMELIKQNGLMGYERYYITTESCDVEGMPTEDIRKCYDNRKDRHRGLTTVYFA